LSELDKGHGFLGSHHNKNELSIVKAQTIGKFDLSRLGEVAIRIWESQSGVSFWCMRYTVLLGQVFVVHLELVEGYAKCTKCMSHPSRHSTFMCICMKSEALCEALKLKTISEHHPRKPNEWACGE